MPFPDAARAVVSQEKVCDYLLNLAHPVGGPKAAWFHSLGYKLEAWERLANDLLQVAANCEAFSCKPSPYGVKYETAGQIAAPGHASGRVIAVWIVEANSLPRLITAFPG